MQQKLVPGIVGISTFVDFAYHCQMQRAAVAKANLGGPINQLRTITATLDFNELIKNLKAGNRQVAEEQVAVAVETLAKAGADFIVVTSGTTSTLTGLAKQRVVLPYLDLAESCFKPNVPFAPIGLLATSYSVAGGQFHAAASRHGADLLVPSADTAKKVDDAIFNTLVHGAASQDAIEIFQAAIDELIAVGAKSVILGNTDLTLVQEELVDASAVPLIDSTTVHANAAGRAAVSGEL
jgi:aspartate racemase